MICLGPKLSFISENYTRLLILLSTLLNFGLLLQNFLPHIVEPYYALILLKLLLLLSLCYSAATHLLLCWCSAGPFHSAAVCTMSIKGRLYCANVQLSDDHNVRDGSALHIAVHRVGQCLSGGPRWSGFKSTSAPLNPLWLTIGSNTLLLCYIPLLSGPLQ